MEKVYLVSIIGKSGSVQVIRAYSSKDLAISDLGLNDNTNLVRIDNPHNNNVKFVEKSDSLTITKIEELEVL